MKLLDWSQNHGPGIRVHENSGFGSLTRTDGVAVLQTLVWHSGSDHLAQEIWLPTQTLSYVKTASFKHWLDEFCGHGRCYGQSLSRSLLQFKIHGSNKTSITLPRTKETLDDQKFSEGCLFKYAVLGVTLWHISIQKA